MEFTLTEGGIAAIRFVEEGGGRSHQNNDLRLAKQCGEQLDSYFHGELFDFDLPLSGEGTDFQKRVWHRLGSIPYGTTISYHQLSLDLGDAKSIRAAASANGRNPLPILIPCHRVIGKDGKLTGYSGGLWRKKWLIDHERRYSGNAQPYGTQLALF